MHKNLPTVISGKLPVKAGNFLAKVRNSKALRIAEPNQLVTDLVTAAAISGRPRLLLAIDETASRQSAWDAARALTDTLFSAIPNALDVGLAVHGGSLVHTFTDFLSDASKFRDKAAQVHCSAGMTCLVPILEKVRDFPRVKVVIYIGDVFEEDENRLYEAAAALRLRGTRVIILQDMTDELNGRSANVFGKLADITQGALLPFDPSCLKRLKELLEAIAVLASGGIKLLETKRKQLPAATLLLEYLKH